MTYRVQDLVYYAGLDFGRMYRLHEKRALFPNTLSLYLTVEMKVESQKDQSYNCFLYPGNPRIYG